MTHRRLSDPEYINWITVGLAIQITRHGLENIVQKSVDNYHTKLLANAKLPKNVKIWKTHLTKAHRSSDKKTIPWNNSDHTKWLAAGGSWEIAKIFMARLGKSKYDVVNAQTTDISGLLNILEWSPRGSNGMFNTGVDLSKLVDARRSRNIWAHAPALHISDADKNKALASFTSLLQDPELSHDKDVQDAIDELNKLLNDRLVVIEMKELELLIELQHQLAQDLVSYMNGKDQVYVKQIHDLMKGLEEFLRENKLQNAIESMKKKLDEHVQSTNSRLEKLEESTSTEQGQSVCDGKSSLNFNPVCDRMKEEFVGREWLFRDIDSWLEKDLGPRESRAFSIRGGPGTGKSSIAGELVRRHEGKKLAGYHYIQKDNPSTCELEWLVDSLSNMLSEILPEYTAFVGHSYLQNADKFRDHPDKLFDYLITTPLRQLKKNTTHFLFIDALDEGGPTIASCFAALSAVLPPWFRVVFTARSNATALFDLFTHCNCANLDFVTSSPQPTTFSNRRNLKQDMYRFVIMKHRKLQNEFHNYNPSFFNNQKAAIEKIVEASQSCFLYAKLVMENIFAGHDEIWLPPTLSEIYCQHFRRLFPEEKFFKHKVAPVVEVVLAITRVNVKFHKDMGASRGKLLRDELETCGTFVDRIVEMGLLSGITTHDLNEALKLLSVYLFKVDRGPFCFSHGSVRKWLQEKKPIFFCDVKKGHLVMKKFHLKTLQMNSVPHGERKSSLVRCLFHSSFLPERISTDDSLFISQISIEANIILHTAIHIDMPEYFAIKVLDETDALEKMGLEEKERILRSAMATNRLTIAAKLFGSAYWILRSDVLQPFLLSLEVVKVVHKKESLPQLLFSLLCRRYLSCEIMKFCAEQGVTADVCVPKFFKNNENFDVHVCWNEDVQEYFRKLNLGDISVVTLESLKEDPSFPEEARIDDYTLEIIQKPISEIERLVKEGECYVCLTYGWHTFALTSVNNHNTTNRCMYVEYLILKHGADVNNRGNLGKTALMMACEKQDHEMASVLLSHGADVNQQDFYGSTALHHALQTNKDSEVEPNSPTQEHIIEILLEHEADPRLKNSGGISAIDIAEQEGGIVLEMLTGKRRKRDCSETDPDTSI